MKHTERPSFMPWRAQYSRCATETPRPSAKPKNAGTEESVFSLAALCAEVLKALHQRIRKRKPRIALEVDSSIPRLVRGNGTQIENILHLLLSNVIALSSDAPVKLSVVTRRFTADGLEALFSIEWQYSDIALPTDPVIEGNAPPGLSFSICSSVITSMGGRLHVKKREKSMLISFFIPLSTDGISEDAENSGAPVLLVEDNAMNRKIIASSLEHGGYAVCAVSTGREALDILFDKEWSIILMDIQMPGMDGLETTRVIREEEKKKGRRTPIVAVTAYAGPEDKERCLAADMDDFLAKPVKLETLLSAVERITGIPSARKSAVKGPDAASAILSFTEGDSDLARKIIGEFLALAPPLLLSMREAFDRKDREKLRVFSHRLKGNLAYFGEGEAFLLAEALHRELDNLSDEGVASTLLRLFSESERLIEGLESECLIEGLESEEEVAR